MENIKKVSYRPGKKRMVIDIQESLFETLKKVIDLRETTLTRYVIGSIVQRLKRENLDIK